MKKIVLLLQKLSPFIGCLIFYIVVTVLRSHKIINKDIIPAHMTNTIAMATVVICRIMEITSDIWIS